MPKGVLGVTLREASGPLADLNVRLAGDEGIKWLHALKKFLRKENPWEVRSWKVWRTVKLGTGLKTADDFRKSIKDAGMKIGDWGNNILGRNAFKVSETEMEVDLVVVSVAELGFKEGTEYKNICARAKELGLELCPSEVGPQLRLQYKNQPKGEWLIIAMKPITDSDSSLGVFYVVNDDGGCWLDGSNGDYEGVRLASNRCLFVLPRK